MKVRKALLAALTGCYVILWLGGVGSHLLLGRTPDDAAWAAPAFLLLAGVLVLLTAPRTERLVLLAVGALGFAVEVVGVHSGWPFGRYQYTDVLQPQLLGVPLALAAAWLVLVAYVRALLAGLRLAVWLAALLAGLWMTALDLVIDPLAAGSLHYWRWLESGFYYGIPAQNFLGWFVVSWLIFLGFKLSARRAEQPGRWALALGLSILLFFTCLALAHHLLLAAGLGCGLSLAHLLVAAGPGGGCRPHSSKQSLRRQLLPLRERLLG